MISDIAALIERARQHDPDAAVALADLVEHVIAAPDRRVAAAFGMNRRGGVAKAHAERLAKQNRTLRALAALLFHDGTPIEQRARELIRRVDRFITATRPHERRRAEVAAMGDERHLLRVIAETDLPTPRMRQMKKILSALHSPV
jgi:uncharacterized protein (DUF924 family)